MKPSKPKPIKASVLLKKWNQKIDEKWGNKCAICGQEDGILNAKGNKVALHRHHIIDKKCGSLYKYDPMNGIKVCPRHHLYSLMSFHRDPIHTMKWLEINHPDIFNHLLSLTNE